MRDSKRGRKKKEVRNKYIYTCICMDAYRQPTINQRAENDGENAHHQVNLTDLEEEQNQKTKGILLKYSFIYYPG